MFKVTFESGETVLEQDSLPTDDDCLYMLDTGEVDIVIAGSGEAANTNQEERKVHTFAVVALLDSRLPFVGESWGTSQALLGRLQSLSPEAVDSPHCLSHALC